MKMTAAESERERKEGESTVLRSFIRGARATITTYTQHSSREM